MTNHYRTTSGNTLSGDPAFYGPIGEGETPRQLTAEYEVKPRTGLAWRVPAGHVVRISAPYGPQVGDLNIWNLNNPRERMWAARTRQLQSAHVSTFDRLWSTLPYLRPMTTIVADTLSDYKDSRGGGIHDLLGTRCDPYVHYLLTGEYYDNHCHSNLVRAVMPYNLTEQDVHDVLNVFQITGLDRDGHYYVEPSPVKSADYIEFFAEIDLLMAISVCPHGDLSNAVWGEEESGKTLESCHPLKIEVYSLDSTWLRNWKQPQPIPYSRMHGMVSPD